MLTSSKLMKSNCHHSQMAIQTVNLNMQQQFNIEFSIVIYCHLEQFNPTAPLPTNVSLSTNDRHIQQSSSTVSSFTVSCKHNRTMTGSISFERVKVMCKRSSWQLWIVPNQVLVRFWGSYRIARWQTGWGPWPWLCLWRGHSVGWVTWSPLHLSSESAQRKRRCTHTWWNCCTPTDSSP